MTPTEQDVRHYIQEYSGAGKSTKMLVAALKFRFNYCEKRGFDFSRLIKQAAPDRKRPHRALKKDQLSAIFNTLKPYPLMHVACRILYDLAARV
jgi:integrase